MVVGSAVRLLAPDGSLAAIARVADGGRLVTDKVLLDRGATALDRGATALDRSATAPDDGTMAPDGYSPTAHSTGTVAPDPDETVDA
jgi:hypothetical protein